MEYLYLKNITKSVGDRLLLDQVELTINKGDKIGIVGKNGTGKSSLLRIITGIGSPEGENALIRLNQSVKVAWLDQEPEFVGGRSVWDECLATDNPGLNLLRQYQHMLKSDNSRGIEEILPKMDDLGAWTTEAYLKELLYKLGIKEMDQQVNSLSGGEKKRLALAKILITEPDFIVLDEPTNHLDIEMIEWLESYLSGPSLTLLMVTHDRYFLDRICNSIIELERASLYVHRGNYTDFLIARETRLLLENSQRSKSEKLLSKELEWIHRQPKARGTKAKSRVQAYEELKRKLKGPLREEEFRIEIEPARLGKMILEFQNASKSFDDRTLIKNFSYKFQRGEKVGICGPNGSGKTTLAAMITGAIALNEGTRKVGDTVHFGHYSQSGLEVDRDKRVIDVIRDIAEYIPLSGGNRLMAASLLERFLFSRDQQQVLVSQLSGGERKRLHLLQILMSNPNFLVLDEPTNDLDIFTLNVLESYLEVFPGCAVIISHDRFFLDKVTDHLFIILPDGIIKDYNGTYSQWKAIDKTTTEKKSLDNRKADAVMIEKNTAANRKLSYHEKREMREIEKRIEKLTERKVEITEKFNDQNISGKEIEGLSRELSEIQKEIDENELRWLTLADIE